MAVASGVEVVIRIAYACPRYRPLVGGVETHVFEVATRLAAEGNRVDVLTESVPGAGPDVEVMDGVTVRRFRPVSIAGRASYPRSLSRHLRAVAGSWDIVHTHDFARILPVAVALTGAHPLVFTPHFHGLGDPPTIKGRLAQAALRRGVQLVMKRAARVICVSDAEAGMLRAAFPGASPRVEVIPNGTSRHPPAGAGERRRVVLAFGRLEPSKNFDQVIDAAPHLPPSYEVQVVGDGSARANLERRAEASGAGQRVRFLGEIPEERVDAALAECGVMVTLSDREAFGLAAFDALASGAPVVASEIPAHRELRDRYGGGCMRLVPIGAPPEALARALVSAAEDGCAPIADLPSWDDVAAMTLSLYREVLGRSGGD